MELPGFKLIAAVLALCTTLCSTLLDSYPVMVAIINHCEPFLLQYL